MGEFSTEQSQISAVEKKAGKLDDQGKKTHETLEAELKAKHDVFFKQVDDTQKIFKEADALKDPVAINEIAKDKQDIKDLLLKAATSGETLLIDKTSDFTTIRQCADRVSKLTSTVKTNVDFFKDMDQANSNLSFAKDWLAKAQKFEGNGEKPQGWQKDYVLFLDSGMSNIGGVSALLKNHADVSSAELKGVYDKIKKEADTTMLLLTESRLKFLDNFPDSVNTYIDDEGKEREINVDQKSTILKIRAIRSGGTILPTTDKVDGYNSMLSLIPSAKDFIEKAGKETDEKQKQSYLDTAKDSLTRAKTSALTITSELATIGDEEARKLPEAFWNLYYTMKVNSASAFAESSNELTKLERGNSNLDGKAAIESAEKEYSDGDDSPKKSYEKAQKIRDDIMNAKEFDLHSPLLGPVVEKAMSKLCVLKGKLSAVDRAALPREYQTRFDAICATVDTNLQEIVQVQVLIKNNKLTEDINQKNDMNKDGKEYFRMVRKEINGQMVVVVEQTEEFKKLPPDQQKIFLAQYAAVPAGITLDLTRKMELKEDKDWNDGMAKFESGDWQGAKPLLLAYWNKFLNNPEKAVQTAATKSLLQAIVKIEFAQAKENFQIMDNVQEDRGDIAGVTRQALGVSVALGWDRMDAAERILNSKDCPLTFVQLWDKVRKMPHGQDLVSEGISFMNPEVQQRMLSEPDPEKRRANILKLARAAKEAGMTPFAKKYFEMYFAGEIANKKKTVTRDQAEAAFNAKPDAAEQIKTGIKTAHDQARTHFITERNRRLNLNGRWPSDKDIADEKVDLERWEANYQANAGDIEQRVRDGVIDDIWMKNVKKALNEDYKNAKVVNMDGSLAKDAPVNVWNEAYGGHFGVAENITDSAIVFTSDDIRNTAAKIAVSILYLEIAAAAGVLTGGAASAAVLGGAAEVGAGTMFASQAVGFVVEGAVMHTVSVGLNEGAEGFKDGGKFMKGLVTTYATLGVMKGTGTILGKIGQRGATTLAEGSGEFVTPFYKGVGEGAWNLGAGGAKLVGKSVLDSTLMTGITWGSEKILNGKSMSGDELVRAFGENMVTFMVMGATHKAAEAGEGKAEQKVEPGSQTKDAKALRDLIRRTTEMDAAAKEAREKADIAKKEGKPNAAELEAKARDLEGKAKTLDAETGTAMAVDKANKENPGKESELQQHLDGMCPCHRAGMKSIIDQFKIDKITDPVERSAALDKALEKVRDYEKAENKGDHIAQAREEYRQKLLDPNTAEGKDLASKLEGKKVQVKILNPDGSVKTEMEMSIDKRLLTPDTLLKIASGEPVTLTEVDVYLHKHMVKGIDGVLDKAITDPAVRDAKRKELLDAMTKGEDIGKIVESISPDKAVQEKLLKDLKGAQEKVLQGTEVFTTPHAEMNAEGRNVAKEYMHETVNNVFDDFAAKFEKETGRKLDPKAIEKIKQRIIEAGIDQHIDNPPQYVSHGFDHSLRVMENVRRLLAQTPEQAAKGPPEAVQGLMDKYKITRSQAELMTQLVGICHDFGYPTVGELNKSLHAVTGTYRFLVDIGVPLGEAMGLDLKGNVEHMKLIKNFANSIECHSADKVETSYKDAQGNTKELKFDRKINFKIKIPGTELFYYQEFLFMAGDEAAFREKGAKFFKENLGIDIKPEDITVQSGHFEGRYVDAPGSTKKGEIPAGIEFRGAELNDDSKVSRNKKDGRFKFDPLLALVRYADNLDMDSSRFSPFQRSEVFTHLYERLGAERSVEGDKTVSSAVGEALRKVPPSLDSAQAVLGKTEKVNGKPIMYEGELLTLAKNLIDKSGPDAMRTLGQLLEGVQLMKYGNPPTPLSPEYVKQVKAQIEATAANQALGKDAAGKKTTDDLQKDFQKVMAKNIYADEKANASPADQKFLPLVEKYLGTVNEVSFRHFGGCNPVEVGGVRVEGNTISVGMKAEVIKKYKGLTAEEKVPKPGGKPGETETLNIPISVYQVWRAVEAYESVTVNGKRLTISLRVGDKVFSFDPNGRKNPSGEFLVEYKKWEAENVK